MISREGVCFFVKKKKLKIKKNKKLPGHKQILCYWYWTNFSTHGFCKPCIMQKWKYNIVREKKPLLIGDLIVFFWQQKQAYPLRISNGLPLNVTVLLLFFKQFQWISQCFIHLAPKLVMFEIYYEMCEFLYILCYYFNFADDGPQLLVIVDQHAAHERVRLEQLTKG